MQTQTFDLLITSDNNNNNINKINKAHPPPPPSDLIITMSSSSTPIHNNNNNNGNPSPSSSASSSNDAQKPQNEKPTPAAPIVNTTQSTTPSRTNPRPARACTARAAAARLYSPQKQQQLYQQPPPPKKKKETPKREDEEEKDSPQQQQCAKIITPLVSSSIPDSQLPRWALRSMPELASALHFLHVFRPLLNIGIEFSAEELETALLNPNDTLGEIHMPLLKAIPPITRISLARNTWITILCRKLRDWWYWVADGDIPIVAAQGAEVDAYNALDPGVRVVILKALCDIRVEQDDIRNYIDNSIKHGVHLSAFRKERVGGDSHGISYWYEDDPVIGHRLYREIRKVEVKKVKTRGSQVLPNTTYQWEAVATNLDEFQDVSEKLVASKNRTEASVGKKLKNDMLPEIEKVHKKKEKLQKKQHREALLLDSYMSVDGLGPGRSLRDRKRVTYTFDDYDRSINEAIKITKQKQPSPEPSAKREVVKPEAHENGAPSGPSQAPLHASFSALSPNSTDFDEFDEDHKLEQLDRSNRRRQRPQRYSAKEYIEAVSDNEADFESDDDIVGEAVYDDEYLKTRKRRKLSSGSEGDDEYRGDEENAEDEEEEEEEEEEDSESASEESDDPQRYKKLPGRTRRETKLRSVREIQSGLRRSNRATRNRINYRQIEFSESENESARPENSNASDEHSDFSENAETSGESRDSDGDDNDDKEIKVDQPIEDQPVTVEEEQNQIPEKSSGPAQDELHGVQKRRFLDLNELAPGSGFDDSPNTIMKDDADDS